jgi:hypothetical protein
MSTCFLNKICLHKVSHKQFTDKSYGNISFKKQSCILKFDWIWDEKEEKIMWDQPLGPAKICRKFFSQVNVARSSRRRPRSPRATAHGASSGQATVHTWTYRQRVHSEQITLDKLKMDANRSTGLQHSVVKKRGGLQLRMKTIRKYPEPNHSRFLNLNRTK